MEPLLKIPDVANLLNCSPSNVYALASSGELRSFRVGAGKGGLRFSMEQITEYLRARETGNRPPAPPPAQPAAGKKAGVDLW